MPGIETRGRVGARPRQAGGRGQAPPGRLPTRQISQARTFSHVTRGHVRHFN